MRLGIDSFSLRWQGWDAIQIMDYAAGLGLDNVHFSEREHLGSLTAERLEALRAHADQLGLSLEIGMRSFNRLSATFDASLGSGEEQLIAMIKAATIIGSPIVRCFVGMASDRLLVPPALLIEETVRTLRAVASQAEAANVTIAVENHGMGDLLAPELRDVIECGGFIARAGLLRYRESAVCRRGCRLRRRNSCAADGIYPPARYPGLARR